MILLTPDLQVLCKALFGAPSRVLLAVWILERKGGAFYQTEAQDGLRVFGLAGSAVQGDLKRFTEHQLLIETSIGNRNYFVQTESGLWDVYRCLSRVLAIGDSNAADTLGSHEALS